MPSMWRRRKGSQEIIDYTNSRISAVIDEYIHNERNRKLLKRRYIDGITYERLAEEFDLSVRQTKAIVYQSEAAIFKRYCTKIYEHICAYLPVIKYRYTTVQVTYNGPKRQKNYIRSDHKKITLMLLSFPNSILSIIPLQNRRFSSLVKSA